MLYEVITLGHRAQRSRKGATVGVDPLDERIEVLGDEPEDRLLVSRRSAIDELEEDQGLVKRELTPRPQDDLAKGLS